MIAVALLIAWIGGLGVALSLDPGARRARLFGLAFPLGLGTCALTMGALSAFGIAWTRASVLTGVAVAFAIARAVAAVRARRAGALPVRTLETGAAARLAGAIVVLLVIGHALFATLAPPGEWDFWAIWGLKGKAFHEVASIDWAWLERPANEFAHPDYPILLPLAYDFAATLAGTWPERQLGLLFTALATSGLLLFAAHVGEATGSSTVAALAALAIAGPLLSVPAGLADLPLLVFGGVALLELRSAGAGLGPRLGTAAATLALAALTKNEGIALMVATAVALLIAGKGRQMVAVIPAAIAAALWIAVRRAHGLGTDLFGGEFLGRGVSALGSPGALWRALRESPPDYPFFWVALALAIALAGGRRLARERFLLVAIAIQLLFFLGAYLVTPREVGWHVATSWPRLLPQLLLPAAFVAAVFAAGILRRPAPDA